MLSTTITFGKFLPYEQSNKLKLNGTILVFIMCGVPGIIVCTASLIGEPSKSNYSTKCFLQKDLSEPESSNA